MYKILTLSILVSLLVACGGNSGGDSEIAPDTGTPTDQPQPSETPSVPEPTGSPEASPVPSPIVSPLPAPTPSIIPNPTPVISPSPQPELVMAINAGGPAYKANDNTQFAADVFFSGGKTYSTDRDVVNTEDDTLFQSERYGNFRYDIAVDPGVYLVELYFSEGYWTAGGERVFDIAVEGNVSVSAFDIVDVAGGRDIAHSVSVSSVRVRGLTLTIEFITTTDNAKLSAFKVMRTGDLLPDEVDRDDDGVPDFADKCQLVPGVPEESGCPLSATPEPTPVVTPSPTTPIPSPSPIVSPVPVVTPTPIATPSPVISPLPSPSPMITPAPVATPSPDPVPYDLALGEDWYTSSELRCSGCHGVDGRSSAFPDLVGESLLNNYDFDSLMLKVLFMSEQHGSITCDGKEPGMCGYEVAAYIWVAFNNQVLLGDNGNGGSDSACSIEKNSGMRRLTKTEIKYAIEDSFGVSVSGYDDLPKERNIGGFESIGAVQSSGSSFVLPMLETSLTVASTIFNSDTFIHNCTDNQLSNCVKATLRPFAEKLSGRSDIDELLDRLADLAVASAEAQAPGSSPNVPSGDQCDTTAQCRTIFGSAANDCVNSQSDQSFCSCGEQRCDVLSPISEDVAHIDGGFKDALVALIMSPEFIYVRARESDQARALGPNEVAKTLARTLWLSVPDESLLNAANADQLSTPEQVSAQIDRMIANEKFGRFKQQFFNQWLGFDNVSSYDVDTSALNISDWDAIASDMAEESTQFMNYLLDNNRSVKEILTADYSFLNERLATHYGIGGVSGNTFEKTTLPGDSNRQGLLTQGAILTRGANGDHASVVIRGETILSGLSCDPPASPDASIQDEVEELANADLSEFEKMAARADKPSCAACHAAMDPIGWAFTGFDAAARLLSDDIGGHINDGSIDPSGIYKGDFYDGPVDMINILNEQNRIEMCLSEKFMMYTLGRPVSYTSDSEDNCIINEILDDVQESLPAGDRDVKMKDLIKAVLMHDVTRIQGDQF